MDESDLIGQLSGEINRLAAAFAEQEQKNKYWHDVVPAPDYVEAIERAEKAEASLAAQAQETETASRLIGLYLTEIGELKKERDTYKRAYEVDMAAQAQEIEAVTKERDALKAAVLAAVEAEEELDGPMPSHMRARFLESPEDSMRATVRATKAGIRARIQSVFAAPPVLSSADPEAK